MRGGPIWLIGAGNMGGAMLRGWLAAGIDPGQITVIDPAAHDLPKGIVAHDAPPPDGAAPATVVLAVKPQLLDTVAPLLAPALSPETWLISILAGIEIASLRRRLPMPHMIARVMPNLPALIGRGVMAVYAEGLAEPDHPVLGALLTPLGSVEWIADERLFDAVTALSGSGPAFVLRFIDALASAGVGLGLPADQALRLALATAEGSARLAVQSAESPATIAGRVASPGGTTRAGLDILDRDNALIELVRGTLSAAATRSAELAAAAR